ncbi:hypothetical protein P154DRAFT_479646 [Amniculicola lignicola CBS 123094]|uniref:Malate dehydrogenase n=1 Tax=Amniculicola lignicola CBS 123094 TaxID=1392246 RepID=A0A6A5X5L7_9PLEO|nr:hypothetical protein P154DRAFT_479646 [Amniculicola lignicola CBS 123094]
MLFTTLSTAVVALTAFAPAVAGLPHWPKHKPEPRATPGLKLQLPTSTLAVPGADLVLKFVGLGVGTQNYTCLTGNATAVPETTGAVAKLYDIGTKLNTDPWAAWKIPTVSGLSLSMASNPRQLDSYLQTQGYQQVLGDHFFTLTTPTFSLNKVKANPFPLGFMKKNADADAPKSACPGNNGLPAIKWLHLLDNGNSQGGVNTIYRVETAGGNKPATCQGQKKTFEVAYAAQYWVYEKKV